MAEEARDAADAVARLASHGIPMTMDDWRDMTMRDRAALVSAANANEKRRRRAKAH